MGPMRSSPPCDRHAAELTLLSVVDAEVEHRDGAPQKGEIVQTADAMQTIKARIDAYREEKQSGGSSPPFFQVTATEI